LPPARRFEFGRWAAFALKHEKNSERRHGLKEKCLLKKGETRGNISYLVAGR
jgi:hypothetical protein